MPIFNSLLIWGMAIMTLVISSPKIRPRYPSPAPEIRTIDKKRLKEKMGHLDDVTMNSVNNAIQVSFGLGLDKTDENF